MNQDEGLLSGEGRERIAALLSGGPIDDLDGFFCGVEWLTKKYLEVRECWTDSMPTAPELLQQMGAVESHLAEALKVLTSSLLTMTWLDAKPGPSEKPGDFADKLFGLHEQALESAKHLREGVKKSSPVIVTDGGVSRTHKRRTRTHTRDKVLVKGIVFWLERGGYDLHSYEDLDTACKIIQEVLTDQDIPCPDPGDTSRDGEVAQGKLRRLIKTLRSQASSLTIKTEKINP